jgi:hypothetical protein
MLVRRVRAVAGVEQETADDHRFQLIGRGRCSRPCEAGPVRQASWPCSRRLLSWAGGGTREILASCFTFAF